MLAMTDDDDEYNNDFANCNQSVLTTSASYTLRTKSNADA